MVDSGTIDSLAECVASVPRVTIVNNTMNKKQWARFAVEMNRTEKRIQSLGGQVLNVKAVVAAFNQEKALVGAFSVLTNLRMDLFQALVEHDSTQDTLTIISLVTSNLPSIPTLFMRHALRTLTAHRKHCPDLSHFNKNLCWYQTTRQGLWGQLQRKERKSVANFKPAIFIKLDSHGSGLGSSTKKLFIVA